MVDPIGRFAAVRRGCRFGTRKAASNHHPDGVGEAPGGRRSVVRVLNRGLGGPGCGVPLDVRLAAVVRRAAACANAFPDANFGTGEVTMKIRVALIAAAVAVLACGSAAIANASEY